MTARILVTVSRSYKEFSTMRTALEKVHAEYPDAVLVHGDAPRGDRDAAGIWGTLGGKAEAYPAKWHQHVDCRCASKASTCRFAGLRRNVAMVESAPDLVLAFVDPQSKTKGASHCAQLAEDAGIPVVRYIQDGAP